MNIDAKISIKKVPKSSKKMDTMQNNKCDCTDELSIANVITLSSSEEPPANKTVKRSYHKKNDKIVENNRATITKSVRKCRYTGTYSAKNWNKQPQIIKTVKLKDRLAEIEKLISQNKDTGIILDYDENEAKKFFEALGIRRICPSHM
ncbi:unnamed protein product [Chironomus riparius]|uniref:Uncharacterized protein n=1 Tax=Chironomus riparius TaxID=315576 RepID=A0A9N9RTZ8_9DIPT|nr:unnamed protein product [Chironomus riparius]